MIFSKPILRAATVTLAVFFVVGTTHLLYGDNFLSSRGLGHDYGFFLPDLLSNYFWIKSQGFGSPPWFTPAFCGGIPAFPDPQSIFYSVPQLLVLLFDPVPSVYLTLLIFTALGFIGMYCLLRTSFAASLPAAIVGASIFALNGFFTHRMLIGHLTFHGAMLIPWFAWALTRPDSVRFTRNGNTLLWSLVGAIVLVYWVLSGMAVLILPAMLAVACLALLHGILINQGLLPTQWHRTAVILPLGTALSAAKIAAVIAYMHHFPRIDYAPGGISNTWETLQLFFDALFFGPEGIRALSPNALINSRHEYEFSLTLVPLLLIPLGVLMAFLRRLRQPSPPTLPKNRNIYLLALILLIALFIPVVLNTAYGPQWTAFLKSIPIIKSSSTLLRWILVFIPIVAVSTALAFDQITKSAWLRSLLAGAACIAIIALQAGQDKKYYNMQPYDPTAITSAFQQARAPDYKPSVQNVGYNAYPDGSIAFPINRNDLLAQSASQLFCYNAIFGYGLEHFPRGALQPGSALAKRDGILNFKNPACYLFPTENNCQPGDHFLSSQIDQARQFLAYRPFVFEQSKVQRIANFINIVAVILLPVLLLIGIRSRRSPKQLIQNYNRK